MTPELISAFADIAWPFIFIGVLYYLRNELKYLFESGSEFAIEFMGSSLSVKPAKTITSANHNSNVNQTETLIDLSAKDRTLPADYLFLNHTSFLRPEMQKDYQKRTGIPIPHYDIRVVVNSYYKGAIEKIDHVEFYLHESYPNPIQVRTNKADRYLLKEVANGEYVLQAKVYLLGSKNPMILQRYLTLWDSGPKIDQQKI